MSVGQTTGETYLFKTMRGSSNPDVNESRYAQMAEQIKAVVESRGLTYYSFDLKRQSYNHGGLMLQVKYILDRGHTGPVAPEPEADRG